MKNLLIVCFLSLAFTAHSLELNNNETVTFELSGNSVTNNLFVNIPATANTLKVEIANGVVGSDFDMFMRFGSDFTGTSFPQLAAEADYSSGGADASEFFTISTALNTPLRAGNWYIAVLNFNANPESINLTVAHNNAPLSSPVIDFVFDQSTEIGSTRPCNIAGWNDTTVFTPIAGNNATTLGQARKNAVLKAAELMTENLQSTVPLIIQGCWPTDLETSTTSAVLANAGPRTFVRNSSGLVENTWYPVAIAERLGGTKACKIIGGGCNTHSIIVNFNPKIDTNEGLGSARWFYGINSTSTSNDPDFISTALHEMTHGLGFLSLIHKSEDASIACPGGSINHTIGTLFCNTIDIFSSFLAADNTDGSITLLTDMASDAERATAMTTINRLVWNSEFTGQSEFNDFSDIGTGLALLYSPGEIAPGSSASHLSRSYTELMEPFQDANLRTLGLATPMLWDIGWDPRPKSTRFVPGLYYDRSRSGHGFSIEPIGDGEAYFIVFYTYKDDGTPEWYTSIVDIVNNVLVVDMDGESGKLLRSVYDFTESSASIDSSISSNTNTLEIDFNSANIVSNAACDDGTVRGDNIALATYQLGDEQGQWCLEPLSNAIGTASTTNDLGGTWFSAGDSGWGVSISITTNDVLVATVYYYDENGVARWVQGVGSDFAIGQEITLDMLEFEGYARTATPIVINNSSAGSLTLKLNAVNQNANDGTLSMDLTYQAGNDTTAWTRDSVPIQIITLPHN